MKNKNTKIYSIGGSGLVGTRVNEILSQNYSVKNFTYESGIDITNIDSLKIFEKDSDFQHLILYAAKTDVDACEKDKPLGEKGDAYRINVKGVENVINVLKQKNKKIIYISTGFVFDGINTPDIGYTENDTPCPVNWYGHTKFLAEELIRKSSLPYFIIRIEYPYLQTPPTTVENLNHFIPKKDFVHAFLSRLKNNLPIAGVTDHIMTPTFIDDIAGALNRLISENREGIFHVTGSQSLSPFDAAILIADKFKLNKSLITRASNVEFFKNRAPRPFNLTMNNDKIKQLGIKMIRFDEGLSLLL